MYRVKWLWWWWLWWAKRWKTDGSINQKRCMQSNQYIIQIYERFFRVAFNLFTWAYHQKATDTHSRKGCGSGSQINRENRISVHCKQKGTLKAVAWAKQKRLCCSYTWGFCHRFTLESDISNERTRSCLCLFNVLWMLRSPIYEHKIVHKAPSTRFSLKLSISLFRFNLSLSLLFI